MRREAGQCRKMILVLVQESGQRVDAILNDTFLNHLASLWSVFFRVIRARAGCRCALGSTRITDPFDQVACVVVHFAMMFIGFARLKWFCASRNNVF
jgi:hypothetical protein